MTESRSELFERGWRPVTSGSLDTLMQDTEIVYQMRCPHCTDEQRKVHSMHLENWSKAGHRDKSFVECRICGHRQEF